MTFRAYCPENANRQINMKQYIRSCDNTRLKMDGFVFEKKKTEKTMA